MPAASEKASPSELEAPLPREVEESPVIEGPANATSPAIAATARSGAVAGEVRRSRTRRPGRSACFSGSTTAAAATAAAGVPKRSSRWRFAACARCATPAAAAASAIVAVAALRKAFAPSATKGAVGSAAAKSTRRVLTVADFPREAHAMPPVMPLCPLSLE